MLKGFLENQKDQKTLRFTYKPFDLRNQKTNLSLLGEGGVWGENVIHEAASHSGVLMVSASTVIISDFKLSATHEICKLAVEHVYFLSLSWNNPFHTWDRIPLGAARGRR